MATNRVHAKGPFLYEEYIADEAGIKPGHLVKLLQNGQIIRHDVEQGRNERMFAQEDALQGKTIGDTYAISTLVGVILPNIGSWVQALLADDETVVVGDWLVSNGDGCLRKEDEDSDLIDVFCVGVAMEDVDTANDSATSNCWPILIRAACH